MSIPEYEHLMRPALRLLIAEGGELDFEGILAGLQTTLQIPDQALRETLPSGRETVFSNRLRWALAYLATAGRIECVLPDTYAVTPTGFDCVASEYPGLAEDAAKYVAQPSPVDPDVAGPRGTRQFHPPANKATCTSLHASIDTSNEVEAQLNRLCKSIYQAESETLIARVHEQSPEFFENLVIDLLLAMGYARRRVDLVERLGRSGDGGLDGVLLEDELGLNRIFFQAKRYKPGVAVPVAAIRNFAGSLEGRKANKGLFLTTSHFPKSALTFIESISRRIVLIDGKELTRLMTSHEVGVRLRATYEVKSIDEQYFLQQASR